MVGFGAVMDLMALLHLPLPFPALDSEAADGKENDHQVKDKTEHNATQYSRFVHPVTIDDVGAFLLTLFTVQSYLACLPLEMVFAKNFNS